MVDSGEPGRLRDLPILLKRTALAAWPRSEVAALGGRDWARFLDATSGGNGFSAGAGETLERLAYGGGTALPEPHELRRLTDAAENWIRRHRPPGGGV